MRGSNTSAILLIVALMLFVTVKFLKKKSMKRISDFDNIFLDILGQGFDNETAKLIFSQAAFETGNFESDIFKENHNLFGMKLPKVRETTATGENRGHATYNTTKSSVRDYYLYWKAFKHPFRFDSISHFVKTLKEANYFEANEAKYKRGVEMYYKLYFNE